jgi:succinoglycan biosynthesis protein ExoU
VRRCGYVAVERANSLSGNHATGDLAALLAFDRMLAQSAGLSQAARAALDRHARQLAVKVGHRAFLDAKRSSGLLRATALALQDAATVPGIVAAILRDKLATPRHATPGPSWEPRYLFA